MRKRYLMRDERRAVKRQQMRNLMASLWLLAAVLVTHILTVWVLYEHNNGKQALLMLVDLAMFIRALMLVLHKEGGE